MKIKVQLILEGNSVKEDVVTIEEQKLGNLTEEEIQQAVDVNLESWFNRMIHVEHESEMNNINVKIMLEGKSIKEYVVPFEDQMFENKTEKEIEQTIEAHLISWFNSLVYVDYEEIES